MVRLKVFIYINLNCDLDLFQFHNGSIKRAVDATRAVHPVPGFNSTMVRLKVRRARQSTLSRLSFNSTMVRLKDRQIYPARTRGSSFNSTMVRLKERCCPAGCSTLRSFQFHNGSIKSPHVAATRESALVGFNSTMVRLKAVKLSTFNDSNLSFNSTMVRLKVDMASP